MTIYDALRKIDTNRFVLLGSNIFEIDTESLDSQSDKKLYTLIKNICSLHVEISIDAVEFQPSIIMGENRSFGIQDMAETDFDLLESIDLEKLPVNIRARIADLLWQKRKNHKASLVAIDAYLEMFNLLYSDDDWFDCIDMIHRVLCLSTQVNQKEKRHEACEVLYKHIIRIYASDDSFLSIRLLEIVIREKYGNPDDLISILDQVIQNSFLNVRKAEEAYTLRANCFKWKKDSAGVLTSNILLAQYYEEKAHELDLKDFHAIATAEQFLKKAIFLYRDNQKPKEAERLGKQLVQVQSKLPQVMDSIQQRYDVSALQEYIEECFDGLSFQEALLRLAQFTLFRKKKDVKKSLLKGGMFPYFFSSVVTNTAGQTILNLKPLSIQHPESDLALLDQHIHRHLSTLENEDGDLFLFRAISIIRKKYTFQVDDLDFLIENNYLIPTGRGNIIKHAIFMSLTGNEYEAIHILAPQIENLFRNLATELGALTVTLEADGTSKSKALTSVFDLPELVKSYDNDILFLFKGLLNDPAGANIRNVVAHGQLAEASAKSGVCIYFFCAIIRLLSYSSRKCRELYVNNPKLLKIKKPKNNITPKPIKN